jgi:hypothetical protein
VIHVLTVHWQDDRWVDLQLQYLNRHVREPFRVYAFLNGLPPEHAAKYFHSSTEPIVEHPVKLNRLAEVAARHASGDGDLLMFLDGDAFPIGDVVSFTRSKLERHRLVAVQRRENDGDVQPHPCFCMTTLGFWREIRGDWRPGFQWPNARGKLVTDVGGNLLEILRREGIDWFPMLRSNRRNLHPLLFGLYEDLVYHHGAGFRAPLTRIDRLRVRGPDTVRGGWTGRLLDAVIGKLWKRAAAQRIREENRILGEHMFKMIRRDPLFFQTFQHESPTPSPADSSIRASLEILRHDGVSPSDKHS